MVAAGVALAVALPGTAYAASGDPDLTWGEEGKAVVASPIDPDRPLQDSFSPYAMRDGAAIVSIDLRAIDTAWAQEILRLDPAGARDLDFAGDGVLMPFEAEVEAGEIETRTRDVDELPGGDLLVTGIWRDAGPGEHRANVYVSRYDESGAPDETYGTDGYYEHRFGGEPAWTTRVGAGGTAVVCGTSAKRLRVIRLTAAGEGVTGFGVDGVAAAVNRSRVGVADCQPTTDGGVIVLQTNPERALLTRFTATGELDPTFGDDGHVVVRRRHFGPSEHAQLLSDGSAVMLGSSGDVSVDMVPAVAKIGPDGSRDESFGDGGLAVVPTPDGVDFIGRGSGLGIDSTGRIFVSGLRNSSAGIDSFAARLDADGGLDDSYGDGGVISFPPQTPGPYELDVYRNGRTLIGGYDQFDLVLLRLRR